MKIPVFSALSLAFAVTLAGCGKTNQETHIFHSEWIPGTSYVTDAKQRIVWTRTLSDGRTILCAEPSPDVAQVFSEAKKLSVGLSGNATSAAGSEREVQANLDLAKSYAGAVAQLGQRLAVIQLLRDEMYRACEAYANGALTKTSYTLKLARLDKKMATLMSSEILAGSFSQPTAMLGSGASNGGASDNQIEQTGETLTNSIREIKEAGSGTMSKDEREKLIDAKTGEAEALVRVLVKMQKDGVNSVAVASAGSGAPSTEAMPRNQAELVAIHRAFIDDTGLEPLMDACVTAMSNVEVGTFISMEAIKERYQGYSTTADFLREVLEGGVIDSKQAVVKEMLPSVKFDAEGNPDERARTEIEELISDTEKKKEETLSRAGEGDVFALKCMVTFMGDGLSEKGFIARMIASKENLRNIEFRKLKLETCVRAANLEPDEVKKRKALTDCAAIN